MSSARLSDGSSGVEAMLRAFEAALAVLPSAHRTGVVEFHDRNGDVYSSNLRNPKVDHARARLCVKSKIQHSETGDCRRQACRPCQRPLAEEVPSGPTLDPIDRADDVTLTYDAPVSLFQRQFIISYLYLTTHSSLIHFTLFGRSIHQLLRHYDSPLANPALKRS